MNRPTLRTCADLFARHRTDVRDFPTDASECTPGGDDPKHNKTDMDDRGDDRPEKHQDPSDCRNGTKDYVDDRRNDVEQEPGQTKDDRLHGIETHKWVPLLQNEKHDAADERDAGECGGNVGREPGRFWRVRGRRRRRLVRHNLLTQDGRLLCQRFSFFAPAKTNTVSL